ncbi:uncharacterized protein [Dendrobates tinctorius]|uniref:uncharacterized protein n=1 Tax=Dendrobates tinctorius TaxID=92724 RepID=UPI003CC9D4F7
MQSIPEMTNYIKNFSLQDCNNKGFSRVLLQPFGYLGHGKSSFINTCKYVLDDTEFKTYAYAADAEKDREGGGANTTERITYELTDTLTLVDNRGCSVMNEYETGEIFAQLGIFPLVVLTHKTNPNLRDVRAKFEDMDVERIFPLENFTPEDHIKTRGKHEDVLKLFIEVIKDIEFRLERFSSPEDEREKRKQFVLQFVYERELRKKEEEMQKKHSEEMRRREMNNQPKASENKCTLQ